MKILIVNNAVPFVWGGAEELAINLCRKLNALKGVDAEVLRIPFSWEPKERLPAEVLLNQNFKLINVDRVIALKFPAYLIDHPRKTIWLLHQFRQAYDLLDEGQSYLDRDQDRELIRSIRVADEASFKKAEKLFTNSPVTQTRLWHYNQISSEVLYPPLNDEDLFCPGPYGDYLFAGGRVALGKRHELLIEAVRHAGRDCRLIIAGPCEDAKLEARLREMVQVYELSDRVVLQLRLHSRGEIAHLVANALACAYIPFQEDSLGYVTMEAFAAARAVVTTTDSGGLLEIVHDKVNGYVCEPSPESLGIAFENIFSNPADVQMLGENARATWMAKNVSWSHTLNRLLA